MSLTSPQTPAALGYRMPAEWKPHRGTWLSWSANTGLSGAPAPTES
ncbi:MAG: hypothetical protein RLY93_08915 [Sumerlaeia bacterium]